MLMHLWRSLTADRRRTRLAHDMTALLTQEYEIIGREFRLPTQTELQQREEAIASMKSLAEMSGEQVGLSRQCLNNSGLTDLLDSNR